jgi:transposase
VWRDRMEVMHKRVAGLDVHKDTVVACVRLVGRGNKVARECQTFATTTDGLLALLSWLVVSRCSHVVSRRCRPRLLSIPCASHR